MLLTTPALLVAAAAVGFGHAIMPDHWLPLAVVARTERYPLWRVARLGAVAGLAHVVLSLTLGAVIIAVGLQFRASVESHADLIVGALLLVTGAFFLALELRGRGGRPSAGHHPAAAHGHGHGHGHRHASGDGGPGHGPRPASSLATSATRTQGRRIATLIIPFGAAASPDLTILPVFLAAAAVGLATSIGTVILFSVVTVATVVGLTVLAAIGGHQLRGAWIDEAANLITASTLMAIGALVITGLI